MDNKYELSKFLAKYNLAGRDCPYNFRYDKETDEVVLLGVDVTSELASHDFNGVLEISIPHFVNRIECQRFINTDPVKMIELLSDQLQDSLKGIEVKSSDILKLIINGNGKPISGTLRGLAYGNLGKFSYDLDKLYCIELHNFDLTNIEDFHLLLSEEFEKHAEIGGVKFKRLIGITYGDYPISLERIKLVNCKIPKNIDDTFLSLIMNGTPSSEIHMI